MDGKRDIRNVYSRGFKIFIEKAQRAQGKNHFLRKTKFNVLLRNVIHENNIMIVWYSELRNCS
jgi:hypothetical protein